MVPDKVIRLYERFVVGTSEGCWGWSGRLDINGYAVMECREFGYRQWFRGHRVSYELANGSINENLLVLHKNGCASRSCTKPTCLYQGTQYDNMRDCVAAGHHAGGARSGEQNYNAFLSDADVRDIVARLRAGEKRQALADEYGTTYQTIWNYDKGIGRGAAVGGV